MPDFPPDARAGGAVDLAHAVRLLQERVDALRDRRRRPLRRAVTFEDLVALGLVDSATADAVARRGET
ncbi:MAG TPA: hypothetical protein ENI87_05360 [bacterium]|nr:hypothetical protein [bacterium]